MASNYYFNFITYILLVLLLSFNVLGRPINVAKSKDYTDDGIGGAMNVFSLAAIKSSSPSAGGNGHGFPTADTFGNIKNSGPSPGGKGHDFTNDQILGEIKNSGPSSGGKGHGFTDAESLGNIKNSGPSAGGKGNGFTSDGIHAEIKNSGPSAGGKGHEFPSNAETLGNILNSGLTRTRGVKDRSFTTVDDGLVEPTSSVPWLGSKRHMVIISENLWNLKNSGPSHGGDGH